MDIQTYDSGVGILATRKFEAIGVMVAGGQGVLPAGTIVGGGVLLDSTAEVEQCVPDAQTGVNDPVPEGVLLYEVDTGIGAGADPVIGTMVIRGNIDINKLFDANGDAIDFADLGNVESELGGRIIFMD